MESLHAFAQGPAHRAGWNWWNRTVKQHPHIGIMHEVYAAPKGHWENIYVNCPPFGMGESDPSGGVQVQSAYIMIGQTSYSVAGQDDLRKSLVEAKGSQWGTMLSRMSRAATHESYEADED